MVEDHLKLIAGVFWSEMCTKHCKAIGLPQQLPYHLTSNSLALFLSFVLSFFLYLFYFFALSLSLALSLPLSLSLGFSLSLSLCRFCGKFHSNNVICSRGYLAITLATT